MDDLTIIELYFDRSEQAIDETDKKTASCAAAWREVFCRATRMQRSASATLI